MRKLSDLDVGESGILLTLDLPAGVQNHLMYMGFVPEAHVRVLHRSPMGDPTVYAVDGMEVALRLETARAIQITKAGDESGLGTRKMQTVSQSAPKDAGAAGHLPELVEAGR